MSNQTFPSLAGLQFASRSTFFVNVTQIADSGARLVVRRYSGYRYHYVIRFLRTSLTEHTTLDTFFTQHLGSFDSFLLTDPVDGTSRRVRFIDDDLTLEKQKGYFTGELDLETVV